MLAALQLSLLHALGAFIGCMVYLASPRYRRYLSANLRAAGYADRALRGAAIADAGKGLLELPAIWMLPHESVAGLVLEVSGWELVEAAWSEPSGFRS